MLNNPGGVDMSPPHELFLVTLFVHLHVVVTVFVPPRRAQNCENNVCRAQNYIKLYVSSKERFLPGLPRQGQILLLFTALWADNAI